VSRAVQWSVVSGQWSVVRAAACPECHAQPWDGKSLICAVQWVSGQWSVWSVLWRKVSGDGHLGWKHLHVLRPSVPRWTCLMFMCACGCAVTATSRKAGEGPGKGPAGILLGPQAFGSGSGRSAIAHRSSCLQQCLLACEGWSLPGMATESPSAARQLRDPFGDVLRSRGCGVSPAAKPALSHAARWNRCRPSGLDIRRSCGGDTAEGSSLTGWPFGRSRRLRQAETRRAEARSRDEWMEAGEVVLLRSHAWSIDFRSEGVISSIT